MQPGMDPSDSENFLDLSASVDLTLLSGKAGIGLVQQSDAESHDVGVAQAERQAAVLALLAQLIDQHSLSACINAAAVELQQRFHCDRVVLGLSQDESVSVAAISQQSSIDARSGEVLLLNEAMQEACDQDCVLLYPPVEADLLIVNAHKALTSGSTDTQICTIPLVHDESVMGAVLLERTSTDPWSASTIELQEQMAAVIAPVLALRQKAEAGVLQRARQSARQWCGELIGPRKLRLKLACMALVVFFIAAHFIHVDHHLRMQAELVSSERRLITSPIHGYVDRVEITVGDQVSKGDLLLGLDVRDLELQASALEGDIRSAESDYRSAMANHDRAEMAVAQARLNQSRAELGLIRAQIERAQLHAPVDGTIISGEFSQMIGAPVDRGSTLLEIAPDGDHQIRLLLSETDIGYVQAGQRGSLSLRSSPGNEIPFTVEAIHPVALSQEGATRFRIDATPEVTPEGLRPGQTGVARIQAGEASILWVWTHHFISWGRQQLWRWVG